MIRLLTMSALGLPLLPESWFLFLSGDMKSRGCLSGVRQNGDVPDSLSERMVLSGIIFLLGVSGVRSPVDQNVVSDLGVVNSDVTGVLVMVLWCVSCVGVNAENAFTECCDTVSPRFGVCNWDTTATLSLLNSLGFSNISLFGCNNPSTLGLCRLILSMIISLR